MENFEKWNPKKDSTGRVSLLEMEVPFCAVGYLHDDQVIIYDTKNDVTELGFAGKIVDKPKFLLSRI